MDVKSLQPAVQELFDHFKGEHRAKIEVDFIINPDFTTSSDVYAFVGMGDELKVFVAGDVEKAIARAKAEFKPKDKARTAAAEKLRQQAKLIETGEAPIPE